MICLSDQQHSVLRQMTNLSATVAVVVGDGCLFHTPIVIVYIKLWKNLPQSLKLGDGFIIIFTFCVEMFLSSSLNGIYF